MKLPKIPRLVWILGGLAAGFYLISRQFSGSSVGNILGGLFGDTAGSRGPQCGPGLYSAWNKSGGFWGVYDGSYKVEQLRIGTPDASGYRVMLNGEQITVTFPDGHQTGWKRRTSNSSGVTPPTIK